MTTLTELYTCQQSTAISKLKEIKTELHMVAFSISGDVDDVYLISQYAAVEGMKTFGYYGDDPKGDLISFNEFVGFDYVNQPVNTKDYRGCALAYALLEPPHSINLKIDGKFNSQEYHAIKTREYTTIYRLFLNDFVQLDKYQNEDFIIYSWSDDWSDFFDAGKEWWGTYYCTVFNKKDNSVIALVPNHSS